MLQEKGQYKTQQHLSVIKTCICGKTTSTMGTLETLLHFKHITCASQKKKIIKKTQRKKGDGRKKTKANQEEAGNECNSCITSNTPSSKLHNIKKASPLQARNIKNQPASLGHCWVCWAMPSLWGTACTHPPLHLHPLSSLAIVLRAFVDATQCSFMGKRRARW